MREGAYSPAYCRAAGIGAADAAGLGLRAFESGDQPPVHRRDRAIRSGQRREHCRPTGLHGVGLRQGPELPDRDRVPRHRGALQSLRLGIGPRPAQQVQRRDRVAGRRVCPRQPLHPRHPGIRQARRQGRGAAGEADGGWGRVSAARSGDRHRVRAHGGRGQGGLGGGRGRAAVRHGLEPGHARRRAEQQFPHRDRQSRLRARHPLHHRAADG